MGTPTIFSEKLKFIRIEKGISQSAAAEGADFDKSFVSRLESGERRPTRDAIMYLSESLDLTADETDELLMAAKFMPVQPNSLLREPKLTQIDDLLGMISNPRDQQTAREHILDVISVLKGLIARPSEDDYAPAN
jgi:transcriptional regulator with XRE-family HTH domain